MLQSPDLQDAACADDFASGWMQKRLSKGAHLSRQGEPETDELMLLDGCMVSSICDEDGKEVSVGLYVGPCVITPHIARTREDVSLVSLVATSDAHLASIDSERLSDLMISSEPIRNWANGILRDALSQKVDREWCLAALKGAERLVWFRQAFPGYEDIFPHTLIAAFLGTTPVTLSRLRANGK